MRREYSFNGSRKSQTTPMRMRRADRYGGILSKRGSRRSARIVGASIVVSPADTYVVHPFRWLTEYCHTMIVDVTTADCCC